MIRQQSSLNSFMSAVLLMTAVFVCSGGVTSCGKLESKARSVSPNTTASQEGETATSAPAASRDARYSATALVVKQQALASCQNAEVPRCVLCCEDYFRVGGQDWNRCVDSCQTVTLSSLQEY